MLTSVKNQTNLPRYFARVFDVAQALENWQLDLALDDGRIFRVEGRHPGPVAAIEVHNPDLFARPLRESDLGFLKAYLDGWLPTPHLQAFMDLDQPRAVPRERPPAGCVAENEGAASQKNVVVDEANRPVGLITARPILRMLLGDAQHEEEQLIDYVSGVGYR